MDKAHQALRDAAEYIREHGWFRIGDSLYSEGPDAACVGTAIAEVLGWENEDERHEAERLFEKHVGQRFYRFNDAPGRTKDEVIQALIDASEETQ